MHTRAKPADDDGIVHDRVGGLHAQSWIVRWLAPIVLVAAVFAAFAPALSAEWLNWDDDKNFVLNTAWRGLGARNLAWMATTFHLGPYQPLSWLTLGADYEIWGMRAPGFHLTNVILHALTALAFWFMARRFFVATRGSDCWFAAWAAALVFALHPLRVESVAWITERRDVLSGLFFVLAIGAWLKHARDERRSTYWTSFAFVILSLLAKASAIVVPILLLVLDVWPLRRTHRGWRALVLEKLPFLAASVVFGALAIHGQALQGDTLVGLARHGPLQRLAQAAFGLVFYAWRTLVPRNLIPIHELPEPFDIASARFVVPILVVIATIFVLVALRKRAPALVAAAIAYAVILAPVSGLVQAGPQLVADRYSYLSCMPFALLFGCGVQWTMSNRPVARSVAAVLVLGVSGVLGILTFRQTRWWHDSETLWRRTLAISPDSPLAAIDLSSVLIERAREEPDPVAAEKLLDEAWTRLDHGLTVRADPRLHANRVMVSLLRAQLEPFQRLPFSAQALADADRAIALGKAQKFVAPEWRILRASALMAAGRCPEAVLVLEAVERASPSIAALPRTLALAYACVGRNADALETLRAALRIEPDDATLWERAAQSATSLGRTDEARTAWTRVLELRRVQAGTDVEHDAQWIQARRSLEQLH